MPCVGNVYARSCWPYVLLIPWQQVAFRSGVIIKATLCIREYVVWLVDSFNPLTAKDPYSGRTARLTSKRCILYIYSTNTGTEYFKHGIYCPFFSSSKCSLFHNSNVLGSCFIHILYTGCATILKNNSDAKRLTATSIAYGHLCLSFRPHETSPLRWVNC